MFTCVLLHRRHAGFRNKHIFILAFYFCTITAYRSIIEKKEKKKEKEELEELEDEELEDENDDEDEENEEDCT